MLHSIKKVGIAVAALAALGLGGSAVAGAASSTSSSSPATAPSTSNPAGWTRPGIPAHENAEKAVTGTVATRAQAAAVKAAGGGRAGAVTTDCRGSGYEVTVTRSNGNQVTIHLDNAFEVQHGPGGMGPAGMGPGGMNPGSMGASSMGAGPGMAY